MTSDLSYRIEKLQVKPGDVLVFKFDCAVTREAVAMLRSEVHSYAPGVKALVLDGSADLSVLTREELAERMGQA